MDWIKSHTDLFEHPKILDLSERLKLDIYSTVGRVHKLWYWGSKFAEDGDISSFGLAKINQVVGIPRQSRALVQAKLIDSSPYLRIHDWWDQVGSVLQAKYKKSPDKWQRIKDKCESEKEPLSNRYVTVTEPTPVRTEEVEVRSRSKEERKKEVEEVKTPKSKAFASLSSQGQNQETARINKFLVPGLNVSSLESPCKSNCTCETCWAKL